MGAMSFNRGRVRLGFKKICRALPLQKSCTLEREEGILSKSVILKDQQSQHKGAKYDIHKYRKQSFFVEQDDAIEREGEKKL